MEPIYFNTARQISETLHLGVLNMHCANSLTTAELRV